MTGLIKASQAPAEERVRKLDAAPPPRDQEIARLTQQLGRLEEELRQRDAQLAEARKAADAHYDKAFAEGRQAGLGEAVDRAETRLSLLRSALSREAAKLDQRWDEAEKLAALLARECLDRLFAQPEERSAIVRDLIARQLIDIRGSTVLQVEVSGEDFEDAEALQVTFADHAMDNIRIRVRPDLPSGGCQLTLELGRLDAGLDQQWGALRSLLGDLANADG